MLIPTTDAEILHAIETFLAHAGMSPTRFGRLVMQDGMLVPQLREGGRSLTLRTAAKIAAFITTESNRIATLAA
jgi:hypothetical protein